ncbi:MAG TPA: hypothetical protein VIW67_07045 [Terriglobales bacterium]
MPHESVEPRPQFLPVTLNEQDPQKITDLIEQLDRDLVETKKKTSKRR